VARQASGAGDTSTQGDVSPESLTASVVASIARIGRSGTGAARSASRREVRDAEPGPRDRAACHFEASFPLVEAKVHAPVGPAGAVPRPRIIER